MWYVSNASDRLHVAAQLGDHLVGEGIVSRGEDGELSGTAELGEPDRVQQLDDVREVRFAAEHFEQRPG